MLDSNAARETYTAEEQAEEALLPQQHSTEYGCSFTARFRALVAPHFAQEKLGFPPRPEGVVLEGLWDETKPLGRHPICCWLLAPASHCQN